MIASALALLLMQVGPAPTSTTFPDIPDETRERARQTNAENASATAHAASGKLAECVTMAAEDAEAASDMAKDHKLFLPFEKPAESGEKKKPKD